MPSIRTIARAFPTLTLAIDIPKRPEEVARRHHNRMTKDALRAVLEDHQHNRLRGHFGAQAHGKYGYAQRTPKYERYKQRRYNAGGIDLVKTGASKRRILHDGQILMGGAAEGSKSKLHGTLRVAFDFRGGGGRKRNPTAIQHVTIDQMHRELKTILPAERREMAQLFAAEYLERYKTFQAGRQRVRLPTT